MKGMRGMQSMQGCQDSSACRAALSPLQVPKLMRDVPRIKVAHRRSEGFDAAGSLTKDAKIKLAGAGLKLENGLRFPEQARQGCRVPGAVARCHVHPDYAEAA